MDTGALLRIDRVLHLPLKAGDSIHVLWRVYVRLLGHGADDTTQTQEEFS